MTENRQRILLVESDARSAQGAARELRERGFEILLATDAIDALGVARRFRPEAIVINSQLAGGGGLTALKRIRANVFTADIPVIIITPRGGQDEREFLAAGAHECLASPLAADAVHAAASRHVLRPLDFTQAPAEILGQPERLSALHDSRLLDSPPEESFDRLTRLASRLLGAGTALVSLVDKDRQFFKSQTGLAQPWAGARQTRLSHSFCQWVVAGKEPLIVEDANDVPALRGNLAIRDLGVVAYAGVPLAARGGHVIGSFCAIESRRRAWSERDLETLRDLCRIGEAYAALAHAQRNEATSGNGLANLDLSIHVAGNAVVGVTRILQRHGSAIGDQDRADLLAILAEQGGHLLALGAV